MLSNLWIISPIISLFCGILVILSIRLFDFIEVEPIKVLRSSLLAGILTIIPILSAYDYTEFIWLNIFNLDPETIENISTFIDAPIIEEVIKGLALLIIFKIFKSEFDTLTDYIIYACCVAIGFAFVENTFYLWGNIDPGNSSLWLQELTYRVIDKASMHLLFSVWIGVALWIWIETKIKYKSAFVFCSFSLSIVLHFINNIATITEYFPIEYMSNLIYVSNQQLALALFIFLILLSISLDYSYLYKYLIYLQKYALEKSEVIDTKEEFFNKITYLICPTNILKLNLIDLLPRRFTPNNKRSKGITHRKLAKLSFAFNKELRENNNGVNKDSSSYIKQGIELINSMNV